MLLFMKFEDLFQETRHPLYVQVYEHPAPSMRRQQRVALVMAAMANEDDAALKLFAEGFESLRMGAIDCIFWQDLREEESGMMPRAEADEIPMDDCVVM
jgi:hypothetical protein